MLLAKPQTMSPGINRRHPLARGLEVAVINQVGAGQSIPDLATGKTFSFGGGAANPRWVGGRHGSQLDMVTDDYIFRAEPNDGPFLGDITLVWGGTIDTGSADRHFAGKHASNGAANNPFDFRTNNAATPALIFVRATASATQVSQTGPNVTLGAYQQYAVTHNVGTVSVNFFIDRVVSAADFSSSITPTGSGASIRIGQRDDGNPQMDGQMDYLFIYSRVLAHLEIVNLLADPFAPFRLDSARRTAILFAGVSAAAAVGHDWLSAAIIDRHIADIVRR